MASQQLRKRAQPLGVSLSTEAILLIGGSCSDLFRRPTFSSGDIYGSPDAEPSEEGSPPQESAPSGTTDMGMGGSALPRPCFPYKRLPLQTVMIFGEVLEPLF